MTFFIESLIACALFTLFVFLMSRNPIKTIFNYPPAIIERCDQLGLVDASNRPGGATFYIKKVVAMMVFGILLGLLVRYVNGCRTFWCGALVAYALWVVVNWFDALVLDCIWFCHDKHFVIPGTEDMTAAYHDYWFHIKGALIGMLLGIPAALVAGAIVVLLSSPQPQTLGNVKSEFVTVDDSVKVHYKIWNPSAKPEVKTLCFIHGFGCDMNTWEKQFEAFRDDDVQLVFIDLPGYGKSNKPRVDYTFDFFAHAIDEVLNENHIKDAVFVGHSLGTPVCRHTLMTTAHGGALVDVDGVYCFYDGTETPEYVEAVNQFGHAFDGPDCREVIKGFVSTLAGSDTPQWVKDYAMSVMPETPGYVASSTMQHLVERQWWPNTQLTLPVMVVCTQNSGLEPDNEQKMRALYPNLDYIELTTCGHFIHMEQAEMFNAKLKAFCLE